MKEHLTDSGLRQHTKEPQQAQRIGQRADTRAFNTRGRRRDPRDRQQRVEDQPYHASTYTVNQQGGGRANSITPFVVTAPAGRRLFPPFASFTREGDCVHTFARTSVRRRPYRRAGPQGIQIVRPFGVIRASRSSPISFLSLASDGHENSRYSARRFACHESTGRRSLTRVYVYSSKPRVSSPGRDMRQVLTVRAKKFSEHLPRQAISINLAL